MSQLPPRLWKTGYLLMEQQDGRLIGRVSRITALDPILPGNVMDVTTRDQISGEERSRSFGWDDHNHELLEGYELAIEGAGKIQVELAQIENDDEARPRYRHVITDTDGTALEDAIGLGGPARGKVDHKRAMSDLLGFLGAAADGYQAAMGDKNWDRESLQDFPASVNEWAYQNSSELEMAALELEGGSGLER